MKNDFLSKLRSETASLHDRLEQNAMSRTLMQPGLTLHFYQRYLQAVYGIVKVFEDHCIQRLQPYFNDVEQRRKTPLLVADLGAENLEKIPLLPANEILELYDNDHECCGGFYVLEGATLGGMVIHKHVVATLGNEIQRHTNYFNAYGKHTGSRWKQFLEALQLTASLPVIEESIIRGAQKTFLIYDSWLQRCDARQVAPADTAID